MQNIIYEYIDNCENICETVTHHKKTTDWLTILYPITDRLIQAVGEHCSKYQSDLIISIQDMYKSPVAIQRQKDETYTHVFGIREYGIDSMYFVQSRLDDIYHGLLEENIYKKIYAVVVSIDENDIISFVLKDITDIIHIRKES
ncbi:hypothetical protein J6A31_06085 [bacterium]|nr:hypothetical protein [bacterium]